MVAELIEVTVAMPAAIEGRVRVGDMIVYDFDGVSWEVPLALLQTIINSRREIDLIKVECLPRITRANKEQPQEL